MTLLNSNSTYKSFFYSYSLILSEYVYKKDDVLWAPCSAGLQNRAPHSVVIYYLITALYAVSALPVTWYGSTA